MTEIKRKHIKKLHKNGPGEIGNHRKITFNYQNLSGM